MRAVSIQESSSKSFPPLLKHWPKSRTKINAEISPTRIIPQNAEVSPTRIIPQQQYGINFYDLCWSSSSVKTNLFHCFIISMVYNRSIPNECAPVQWCANPNSDSDSNPDLELFWLDLDLDSELESKNADSYKKKRVDSDSDSNPDSRFLVPITSLPFVLVLLPPGAFYGHMDSNPDSDLKQLDSDSRKKGWIWILRLQ